jgi:ER-bound oxygenase mpaB/B'/Rubber oxygenase, catalytic domain
MICPYHYFTGIKNQSKGYQSGQYSNNLEIKTFVDKNSIVRQIWGKADTILFIFCGAAAEFSLNKAVDWLYFTGKLPSDPLGRLFSTVNYAKQIIYSTEQVALKSIDKISAIHSNVEINRGQKIPDWAYRDVLYMLIYYSIAAFELLERKLSEAEKEEIFDVFKRVGQRMKLKDLPENYNNWLIDRDLHMENNLIKSQFTTDLFDQYKKHLGYFRYQTVLEGQKLILPKHVKKLLNFSSFSMLKPMIFIYKISRKIKLDKYLKIALMPPKYYNQIIALDS